MGNAACELACQLDERVVDGCVAISAGHPSTAALPSLFGPVSLAKVAVATAPTPDAVTA